MSLWNATWNPAFLCWSKYYANLQLEWGPVLGIEENSKAFAAEGDLAADHGY